MNKTLDVSVKIERHSDPLVQRAFVIMKNRIEQRCPVCVVQSDSNVQVELMLDSALAAEGFRIDQVGSVVRVAGGSPRGLLYGVGKFLRTSRYQDGFQSSMWRGVSIPQGSLRGMYFANHFHNWYQMATEEEVIRYTEDLALWGINTLMVIFPIINLKGWDDPETKPGMEQTRKLLIAAKDVGLSTAVIVGNVLFTGTPAEVRATRLPDPLNRHGNSGTPVCPSHPAGRDLIIKTTVTLMEQVADLGVDYLCTWPYDEGGCGCDQCRPWGGNGFIRMSRDITEAVRKVLPKVKLIISTWTFDTPPEGEWQGLTDALARDPSLAHYIMADAHEDFPRYPLDVGVPGNLPLINFPEISMWGNWPWGGMGAHTLPGRLQRLFDQTKHVLKGGFPYSEGIYEDMSKVIEAQFYWDANCTARSTLQEYIAYEFSPAVVDDVMTIVDILETVATNSSTKAEVNVVEVRRASEMAEAVNAILPAWAKTNWRWEILHLRTILERERFAGPGLETPAAEAAMLRLMEIFHCQMDADDPYHWRVRPPLKRATSRNGQC